MIDRRAVVLMATIYAAIFVVASVAAEAYLRVVGTPSFRRTSPGEYRDIPEASWWAQSDAYLGWTGLRGGPDTNAQGFRDDKDFSDVARDRFVRRVMILGDSFMYGAGGPREESVPHLLAQRLRDTHQVFNVAVPGWGIDQMYLAYRQYKDIIRPHVVILAFIDDDVSRVLQAYRKDDGLNKPSFKLQDGELHLRTALDATNPLLNRMMRRSRLFGLISQETYLALEARPIVRAILSKITQEAHEEDRRFVVLRIPLREQSTLSGRIVWQLKGWRTVSDDVGAEYLDPLGEMRTIQNWATDFYLDDGHLSAAGNRQLASFIHSRIFQDTAPTRHGIVSREGDGRGVE